MATICGMAVNCTRRAAVTPINAPIIKPTIIHSYLTMSRSMTVNPTAISMPNADSRFPARAVSGDRSQSSPTMKRTDATMYGRERYVVECCRGNLHGFRLTSFVVAAVEHAQHPVSNEIAADHVDGRERHCHHS